ncbi:MAG: sigma-70 family RNA polymerase sigma factor [Planctomycetes bacterium]|nr:sigma-70 family RNA polymerase sigma factor [Planctomycetota bacterium]
MQGDPPSPAAHDVAAVLASDPLALDRWYRAEHPAVWRLCLGLLGSEAEAEDAAQDAMLKLHDHLDRWDPRQPYGPWRNTVVLNLCRDRLRRREARARAEAAAAEARELTAPAAQGAALEQHELRAKLAAALRLLSEREREAFVLRELEGESTAAVARAMDVTESSVRSLLTLARRRLRDHLAPARGELLGGADV